MTEEPTPETGTTPTPPEPSEPTGPDASADVAAPAAPAPTAAESAPAPSPPPTTPASAAASEQRAKPTPGGYYWGTGRRKTAIARVRVRPGDGQFKINNRDVDAFFRREVDRRSIRAPLEATEMLKKLDVFVNVLGGGTTGQAGAIVLGIARALNRYDSQYEHTLRDGGYLTRDDRRVERKKYGQRGARRRFQFSKR